MATVKTLRKSGEAATATSLRAEEPTPARPTARGGDAIVARDLRKSFGKVQALRGLSLRVQRGTVVAILGPNGAGKTTLLRILTTLLRPDGGEASVAGHDVVRDDHELRRVTGLAGQNAAVDENLTGRENLYLVARFYHLSRAESSRRAEDLLKRLDLLDAADRPTKGYSGGMRRRLDLAASLVGDPEVIFLDEPTVGLDPPSRLTLWSMVEELRTGGKTILLTTQNLEEADRLADRIVVVDKGTIIAEGTSEELKAKLGGDVVEISFADPRRIHDAARQLEPLRPQVDAEAGRLRIPAAGGARTLAEVLRRLDDRTLGAADVALRRPTLDDVFLSLTGHGATNGSGDKAAAKEARA